MDLFTHAFIPYIIAKIAGRGERDSRILGFGGTVPDFDSLFMWIPLLIPQAYAFTHRGITHSVLFALPFSMILLYFFSRGKVRRFMARFVTLDFDFSARSLGIVYIGSLVHMTMDFFTTGGIPLLYPLSEARYAAHLFFYVDSILMVVSLLIVIFFLFRKPAQDTRVRTLYALLLLYLVLGGAQFAFKSSIDMENATTYPTYSMFSWVVLQDDGTSFTAFTYDPLRRTSGEKYVYRYTDRKDVSELVQKARILTEVRAFMFHENAEVSIERKNGAYTLYFYDPVNRLMSETAPPYMRHFIPGITVVIFDDGSVELVDG